MLRKKMMNVEEFANALGVGLDAIETGRLYYLEERLVLKPVIELLLDRYGNVNQICNTIPYLKPEMFRKWKNRTVRLSVLFKQRVDAFLKTQKSTDWDTYPDFDELRKKLALIKDFDTHAQDKIDILATLVTRELTLLQPIFVALEQRKISLSSIGIGSLNHIYDGSKCFTIDVRAHILAQITALPPSLVTFDAEAKAALAALKQIKTNNRDEARDILDNIDNILPKADKERKPTSKYKLNMRKTKKSTPTEVIDTLPPTEPQIPDLTHVVPTEPATPSLYPYLYNYYTPVLFGKTVTETRTDDLANDFGDGIGPDEGLMEVYNAVNNNSLKP